MKYLLIVIALATIAYAQIARADTIILDAVDRGWYASDGGSFPDALSYFVGNSQNGFAHNNWFVFDLTGIDQPIVSAELHLFVTSYFSVDPTETYTLFDVTTDPSVLMNGTGGIPAFNDLGSGAIFGSHLASSADNQSFIDIALNPAAIGSLIETGGYWAVGGAITTLDNDPSTIERMFAATELLPLFATQLVINTIPTPGGLALFLAPMMVYARRRRRQGFGGIRMLAEA